MEPEDSLPCPQQVFILSQIDPDITNTFYPSKIHFNIMRPPMSWSS
jgi:hypothetical protein